MSDILDDNDKTKILIDKTIYIIQYPKGELSASYGVLTSIYTDKKYSFIHKCSTEEGSSGSPVLNLNNKVIGIHKKTEEKRYNEGTFLNYPLKEFIILNYNNNKKKNNNIYNYKEKNEILIPESNMEYNINITEYKINEQKFKNIDNYLEKSKKTQNELPINIEDLMIFEDKLNEIIFIFNNSGLNISNECFDFLNYYNNCSFNCKLENLFKTEGEKNNVISSIKYLLISLIICYDFCFEKDDIIYKNFSILSQILGLNHRNIIVIFEYFFAK